MNNNGRFAVTSKRENKMFFLLGITVLCEKKTKFALDLENIRLLSYFTSGNGKDRFRGIVGG